MKCDDGAARAVEPLLAALLARHTGDAPALAEPLSALTTQPVRDFNGTIAGRIRLPGGGLPRG
jgi:L-asparaginase II